MYPRFRIRVIACGLKSFGVEGFRKVLKMADDIKDPMIVGYDLVQEEDYHQPLDDFLPVIYEAKLKHGDKINFYMHAGESTSRHNTELYDAIILGCKRIGHGFALTRHPHLLELVKEKKICLECCPCSNLALGYVTDPRCHPARSLINQGVHISINADD
jgi:adenosine deaminase CECR1